MPTLHCAVNNFIHVYLSLTVGISVVTWNRVGQEMQRRVGHDTTEFALVAGVLSVDVILESTSWDCMF